MAQAKIMDAPAWVRLAQLTGSDALGSPILGGMRVDGEQIVATDRHRLHVARCALGLADGVYSASGVPIEGTYPKWQQIMPEAEAEAAYAVNLEQRYEGAELIAALTAFDKLWKSTQGPRWLVKVGPAYVRPLFLADALRGMVGDKFAGVWAPDALKPILVRNGEKSRQAVIMPVKVAGDTGRLALDLTTFECVSILVAEEQVA